MLDVFALPNFWNLTDRELVRSPEGVRLSMLSTKHSDSRNESKQRVRALRRVLAAFVAMTIALIGIVSVPSAAMASPNSAIVVDQVTVGGGTGPNGQIIVGDTISISGTWDASAADPHPGDTFMIGLPPELQIPLDIPFELKGPRQDGSEATWATCLASSGTNQVVCTLTDEVEANPALVSGDFSFDSDAVEVTTEKALTFNLNGQNIIVDLPGGGIGDGIELPQEWTKAGAMNANNWSMTWTIDLPGSRMQGENVINIADTLGAGHVLCEPANLRVQTVRGDTINDVTYAAEIVSGADNQHFIIRLTAPAPDGFDSNVMYRITYETCTPDGQIDPVSTEYTNEAEIDVWGESSGVIGVNPFPWQGTLTKSGSVLGAGERFGKIAWTVSVPGDQLLGKNGFTFKETLGAGHELCPDTISDIRITERYGPSNQLQRDVTSMLTPTIASSSAQGFEIRFDISDPALKFRASDYRYVITYKTCVTDENLPDAGTTYTNEVNVDGQIAGTEAKVPGRTDEKNGAINTSAVTIDGVDHLPQTTMNWTITVPGERLTGLAGDLTVTDTITGAHQVCMAGDPTDGIASQLGLKVEARDQVRNGGLAPVDISASVLVAHDKDVLTFTIPQPKLPQPDGLEATGFSTEYQYLISYTTCTSSGGMDAPGTTYGNTAEVAGKTYEKTVTQNNRGSGSGKGVPSGSVSITKALADTAGAEFVPEDATFRVHVQEIDPSGTSQLEYDLDVSLNGEPVSGPNARGTGWTLLVTEPTFPNIPGVTFGDPVFAPADGVTVSEDGISASAAITPGNNIAVSVTNTAQLGSVSITKALEGGAADLVPTDLTYEVTAEIDTSALGSKFPAQASRVFDLSVGTPVVLDNLPIGATVTFAETGPSDNDNLTWGEPIFTPERITVSAAQVTEPAAVTLTNSVERTVGTFSLAKTVTGDQADHPAVPSEVAVTATWVEDGTPGEKTITLPTNGTSVPFGENLLIGTEVTLTETPLENGPGMAWGAPMWSGTGVSIKGESAVVSVVRDPQASVRLENHAVTSVAGISLLKGIVGEAASEVDPRTEFPVTATWVDAKGAEQSKDLTINAVEPTPLGEELPAGTVVTITEGSRPGFDTVVWESITISGDRVIDNGDGSAEVIVSDEQGEMTLVTVTNEATWAPGTFSLAKEITGVLLDNPDVPGTVTVTASWFEGGEVATTPISVPTDGTVVPFGENLPHGTEVTLSEDSVEESAAFTWDAPTWEAVGIVPHSDGTATITIGAATDIAVNLTNNANAALGVLTMRKTLSGDGMAEIPADTAFPVTAAWTDLLGENQQIDFELRPGKETIVEDIPLGTEVTLTEGTAGLPSNLNWVGALWSSDAGNVAIDGEGQEVIITVTGNANSVTRMDLDNEFRTRPALADTGSTLLSGGIIALAASLIGAGILMTIRRRA